MGGVVLAFSFLAAFRASLMHWTPPLELAVAGGGGGLESDPSTARNRSPEVRPAS